MRVIIGLSIFAIGICVALMYLSPEAIVATMALGAVGGLGIAYAGDSL